MFNNNYSLPVTGSTSQSQMQQSWEPPIHSNGTTLARHGTTINTRAKPKRQIYRNNRPQEQLQGNTVTTDFTGFKLRTLRDSEEKHEEENEMPRIKTPLINRANLTNSPSASSPPGSRDTYSRRKSGNTRQSGRTGTRRSKHNSTEEAGNETTSQLPQILGASTTKRPQSVTNRNGNNDNLHIVTEDHSTASVTSIKGLKPGNPNWTNQDNFLIMERFDNRDVNIYCVLDGHGESGHLVSKRCREVFPQHLRTSNLDMKRAFSLIQNDLNSCDIDVRCSGATCVMVTLSANKLAVSNCGDSRAVLGRRSANGTITPVPLSNDHKPDKPEERKRVLACGGHLGCRQVMVSQGTRGPVTVPVGPTRVWYQFRGDTLGLAMSRSLGDAVVHRSGVSAEPETIEHIVDDYDDFLIIATDGIWDVVDNSQAVQLIQNFAMKGPNWSPLEASAWLCKFARARWEKLSPMIDDITCVIVKLSKIIK